MYRFDTTISRAPSRPAALARVVALYIVTAELVKMRFYRL